MSHVHGITAASRWSYLPLTMPTGASAALAQWQFDNTANDLVDRTGNGHDLTLTAGTAMHAYVHDLMGLAFADLEYYTAALPAPLRLSGALTLEVLHHQVEWTGNYDTIIRCAGATDAEADNFQYGLFVKIDVQRVRYVSEHGAGVDDEAVFAQLSVPMNMELLTLTRSALGALCLYQNGQLVGTAAVTMPTGGGNAVVNIGGDASGLYNCHEVMFSMRISNQVLTAAQVLETYQSCRE